MPISFDPPEILDYKSCSSAEDDLAQFSMSMNQPIHTEPTRRKKSILKFVFDESHHPSPNSSPSPTSSLTSNRVDFLNRRPPSIKTSGTSSPNNNSSSPTFLNPPKFRNRVDSISLVRTHQGCLTIPDQPLSPNSPQVKIPTSPIASSGNSNSNMTSMFLSDASLCDLENNKILTRVDSISLFKKLNGLNTQDETYGDSPRSDKIKELNRYLLQKKMNSIIPPNPNSNLVDICDSDSDSDSVAEPVTIAFSPTAETNYMQFTQNSSSSHMKRRDSIDLQHLRQGTNTICSQNIQSPRWKKISAMNRKRQMSSEEKKRKDHKAAGISVDSLSLGLSLDSESDSENELKANHQFASTLLRRQGGGGGGRDNCDSPRFIKLKKLKESRKNSMKR